MCSKIKRYIPNIVSYFPTYKVSLKSIDMGLIYVFLVIVLSGTTHAFAYTCGATQGVAFLHHLYSCRTQNIFRQTLHRSWKKRIVGKRFSKVTKEALREKSLRTSGIDRGFIMKTLSRFHVSVSLFLSVCLWLSLALTTRGRFREYLSSPRQRVYFRRAAHTSNSHSARSDPHMLQATFHRKSHTLIKRQT